MANESTTIIGKFAKPHGVKGWVSIYSFTEPKENLFNYSPLLVKRKGHLTEALSLDTFRPHGNHFVAKLTNIHNRDEAALYTNGEIVVNTAQLPSLKEGEYYWKDLEGLAVFTTKEEKLGIVDHLFETGANDVIIVKGTKTHYIPYHPHYIQSIDLENKKIIVDWDPNF